MNNVPELEASDVIAPVTERRRPGRSAQVSSELIPLLRGQAPLAPDQFPPPGDIDQLRGARGLAIGAVISVGLWAALGYLAYCIF